MRKIVANIPVLPSRDLDRSARFYARLGYEVVRRCPDYAILACGGSELHFAAAELEPETNPAGLYFRVAGIDQWASTFGNVAEDKPWGEREFAISDPDENLLRFGEPLHPPLDGPN
jgi:catechol 2,3-dioxygenase-like lactoylglutathione lyase family enzyme